MMDLATLTKLAEDLDGRRLAARIVADLGLSEGALVIPRFEFELAVVVALGVGEALAIMAEKVVRHCRVCACTQERACLGADGKPCSWVEADLCSVCAKYPEPGR